MATTVTDDADQTTVTGNYTSGTPITYTPPGGPGFSLTLTGALCLAWVFAMLAKHLPDAGGAMNIVRIALPHPVRAGSSTYRIS